MAPANTIDTQALSAAICTGMIEGNRHLMSTLISDGTKRHDFREVVQHNSDKLWELDGEVKLIKGFMTTLMGSGDGNGGIVNRIDKDMSSLADDVSSLKSQVIEINAKSDKAIKSGESSKSFMDGWKGVGIAISVIGASLGVITTCCGALWYLFSHLK